MTLISLSIAFEINFLINFGLFPFLHVYNGFIFVLYGCFPFIIRLLFVSYALFILFYLLLLH